MRDSESCRGKWYNSLGMARGITGPIFAFLPIRLKSGREKLSGLYRFAAERGREVRVFDGITTACQLRTLISSWHPAGCLVEASFLGKDLAIADFAGVPTVFQGLDPCREGRGLFLVQQDPVAVVDMGAEELFRLGYRDCAYIGTPERYFWDRARRDVYAKAARARRIKFHDFDFAGHAVESKEGHERLKAFMQSLPKPCAVMVAADYLAATAISVCKSLALNVPGELAFVGIDDDELICENTRPKLTSVHPDFEKGGYLAAALLEERLLRPKLRPCVRTYGPNGITRRGSSARLCSDMRVNEALSFIREHCCEEIGIVEIAAAMKCGRRFAERHFCAATGRSILDALRAERLEHVFRLLRNPRQDLGSIPALCGYSSAAYLKTYFKRVTGLTMSAWRKRCGGLDGVVAKKNIYPS